MKEYIRILSVNVGRGSQNQTACFSEATREMDPIDLILIQEPWWSGNTSISGPARSTGLRGWTPFLPKSVIGQNERPRVHAYARNNSPFHIQQRFDIIEDLDVQILDLIYFSPHRTITRLINVYNQKPPRDDGPEGTYAIEKIKDIQFPPDIPTIFVGDWNTKHPRICVMPEYQPGPSARARLLVEWMDENGMVLWNEHNRTTRISPATGKGSALDLTILNGTARQAQIMKDWTVMDRLNGGSDHFATAFSIGKPGNEIQSVCGKVLNWKGAEKKEFLLALAEEKERVSARFTQIFGPVTHPGPVSKRQIDDATKFLADLLVSTADRAVKVRKPSKYANPWWDRKCTEALAEMRQTRSESLEAKRQNMGIPDWEAETRALHAFNRWTRVYKKAKRDYYNKMKEEANQDNIWSLYKWGRGERQYQSPPIRRTDGSMATEHSEKCEILRNTLLPPPPDLPHIQPPNLDPLETDSPWTRITRNEVRDSIRSAAPYNAPGPSGLAGIAWKWAYEALPDEIYHLIAKSLDLGYHPRSFHDSITVILQKPDKPDYSIPKAYRPIQLLEVLGKVMERIQARRIAYHLLKNDLISPYQLGGVRGRSAEDISLAILHDIESSLNRQMTSSLLTFDISGFFNNVSHPVLLNRLRELKVPLPIVKWVNSFLRDRRTVVCLDGRRDEMVEINTGVPQGSCVSPILACCLTTGLEGSIKRALSAEQLPQDTRENMLLMNSVTSPTAIYVDDGAIATHSDSLATNIAMLRIARSTAEQWLNERGLSTELSKDGLIHFSRRRRDQNANPQLQVTVSGNTHTVTATSELKWLGITYDRKLNFNSHTKSAASKALRAIALTGFLGNSLRGISQEHRRLFYICGIRPILTYGSTVWWKGSRTHINILTPVQNRALRLITGGFRTSPTTALEVESSVPPIDLFLDYLRTRAATRISKLTLNHPVVIRLPPTVRPPEANTLSVPLKTPYLPVRQYRNLARRHNAEQARLEEYAESTQLWKLAAYIIPGTENINILAETPWHRTEFDADLRDRICFLTPPNDPNPDIKEIWTERHHAQITQWKTDNRNRLLVYTDGSLSFTRDGRHTGWGFVGLRNNAIAKLEKGSTGPRAEAYDAEMEALAQASSYALSALEDSALNTHSVHFFTDNTGAIQRIFKGTPGKAQSCSLRFRQNILQILDHLPDISITVEWVPGHCKIQGNEIADRLAKRGSRLQPPNPGRTSYAYVGATWKRALGDMWRDRWASITRHPRADFTPADRFPPQLSPTRRFTELSRTTFSRSFQARTGHAHIGAYYSRFVPTETVECPCGEPCQTRNHILLECEQYERFRHLLGQCDEDRALDTLLGTDKGIARLAEFIEVTDAFAKVPFV